MIKFKKNTILSFFFIVFKLVIFQAQVTCPSFFSDNMVLQRETKVSIWGWSNPNEVISIKASWYKNLAIKADKHGNWITKITTPKAGGPYVLTIKGSSELIFKNVMIGEVWFCSGQSNMGMTMRGATQKENIDSEAELSKIRLFKVKKNLLIIQKII